MEEDKTANNQNEKEESYSVSIECESNETSVSGTGCLRIFSTLVLAILAITFIAVSLYTYKLFEEISSASQSKLGKDNESLPYSKIEVEGHEYILIPCSKDINGKVTAVHNENCPCKNKI